MSGEVHGKTRKERDEGHKGLAGRGRPRGLFRWLLRLPLGLYHAHLGWMFGDRALMLTCIGRKTGRPHETVIEVVRHDRASNEYIIASGWGTQSDWFRNIQKTPAVQVQVGRKHWDACASVLPVAEAEAALEDYARKHPVAFHELARTMFGRRLNGDAAAETQRLSESIPLVALRPGPCP